MIPHPVLYDATMHLRVQWINLNTKRARGGQQRSSCVVVVCRCSSSTARGSLASYIVFLLCAPFCLSAHRASAASMAVSDSNAADIVLLPLAVYVHPMPYHGNSRIPTVRCVCRKDSVVIQHAKWYIFMVLCSSSHLFTQTLSFP